MLSPLDSAALPKRQHLWIRRWIALLAAVNLALVFFDLTYLNLRPFYVQWFPRLVELYDPIKGIRPHPETQRYIERVAALKSQLAETELDTPEVSAALAELRLYSQQLVQHHPFPRTEIATLETIRSDLQARTGAETPLVAFERFWSLDHLAQAGWVSELAFWDQQIHPLLAANYYQRVNRFGQPVDYFWLLDLPFLLIFAVDIILRNRAIQRRYFELNWYEALIRHWYDLLLLLPFWRWLRLLPVTIRLQEVDLINLKLLQTEARRDFAIGFAKDVIELAGIQAINEMQAAIDRGDVMRWLLYPESRRTYVQVNNQNEVKIIAARISNIVLYDVFPEIQTELEELIRYSLHYVIFDQVPGYRQLNYLPGLGKLSKQTTERLTETLTQRVYQGLMRMWKDPTMSERTTRLFERFREALAAELQKQQNVQEFENLLIDLLEEIKINYVRRLSETEIAQILDEAERLYDKAETYDSESAERRSAD
ncbi:MAG: hypothetical protein IGS38_04410 [Synechococcales cyanobacterium M58_A2018_015]|nr:hypothetical protein [Synechococcales cyanobacterium M58_A2018_015]